MENPFYDSPATKNRKNTKEHFKKKKKRLENRVVSKARSFGSPRAGHVHETFNSFCFLS